MTHRTHSLMTDAIEGGAIAYWAEGKRVKRNSEGYVTSFYVRDGQLAATMAAANDKWRAILQLLYSTGQRSNDIRLLTRQQIQADGIHFTPSKTASRTGQKIIIKWTDFKCQ